MGYASDIHTNKAYLQPSELETRMQTERDLGQSVGHFLLHQLIGGQRFSELFPLQSVGSGGGQAELGRTQGSPTDAVTGVVQAAKRALQT